MDAARGRQAGEALADYCGQSPVSAPPGDPAAVEAGLLELFHRAAGSVPAYQDFLHAHGVDPAQVRDIADFRELPLMTRENYHLRYPLPQRCRDGRLESCDMIAVSSGSTGRPAYWPRSLTDELAVAARFEQIFHDSFEADRQPTLAVVCFPLGTWVGGLYTASCCRHLALKGYPVTVIAPGNDKEEILRVTPELAPGFAQTVLLGYPPFLKDVIDTGISRGVNWPSMGVRLVLAGEVFSEDWRDLVGSRAGLRRPAHDSAALYGTADAGVLGNETPLSITIRRFLARAPQAAHALFGQSRLPTLVQYDPLSRFFEAIDGTLLFTGDNGVPLIRYHIADEGGVLSYEEMLEFCTTYGFDPLADHRGKRGAPPLPFAYVFGRSHFTVSFFGANIYPENVAAGLEQSAVSGWVTGKFVLEVAEDTDRNPHLAIAAELAPGEYSSTDRQLLAAESIRAQLSRLNSEFAHYVPEACQTPRVTLLPAGDPDYFPRGVKHRYTRGPAKP
jgi:phenylacetate-CoA ligase